MTFNFKAMLFHSAELREMVKKLLPMHLKRKNFSNLTLLEVSVENNLCLTLVCKTIA